MAKNSTLNMRKLVYDTNRKKTKSQNTDDAPPQDENRAKISKPRKEVKVNDKATIPSNVSTTSWDFFIAHCREFDTKDPGLCIRIDRKVKKKLDLAKARFSFNVSEKGMASAIILHFLEENDALFDAEPEKE